MIYTWERCEAPVYRSRSFRSSRCSRRAINDEDSKQWCKQHTPSLVKAKKRSALGKWDREYAVTRAQESYKKACYELANSLLEHGVGVTERWPKACIDHVRSCRDALDRARQAAKDAK